MQTPDCLALAHATVSGRSQDLGLFNENPSLQALCLIDTFNAYAEWIIKQ